MKRNRINLKTIVVISRYAILLGIAFFQFAILSDVLAGGRVFIRKNPASETEIRSSKNPGFDSDWSFPESQKAPVEMNLDVIKRQGGKVTPENPKEVQTPEDSQFHFEGASTLNNNLVYINVKQVGKKYQVMLPEPAGFCSTIPANDNSQDYGDDNERKPEDVFLIGEAQKILVWNGKGDESSEQLLICSERVRAVTNQMEAVLNIVPLPGQPIQIKRASASFDPFLTDLNKRIDKNPMKINPKPYVWNGRIASYGVQSFEAKTLEEFLAKAENLVANLYGDLARVQWQSQQLQAIKRLLENGYTWFAVDVSLLREWATVTESIAYRTKSKSSAIIPLLDLKIGCANPKAITKTIVITPEELSPKCIYFNQKVMQVGNKAVNMSVEELHSFCPEAAAFCKEHKIDKVVVQILHIESNVTENSSDVVVINNPEEKPAEQPKDEPAANSPVDNADPAAAPADQKDAPKPNNEAAPADQKDAPKPNNEAAPAEQKDAPKISNSIAP